MIVIVCACGSGCIVLQVCERRSSASAMLWKHEQLQPVFESICSLSPHIYLPLSAALKVLTQL